MKTASILNSNPPAPRGISSILPSSDLLKNIISKVAFLIFNAFAFRFSPVMWVIGFGIGLVFRHEVKHRITDFFESIMRSPLALQLAFPAVGLMYWFALPGILMEQGVMAGAAFGSELASGILMCHGMLAGCSFGSILTSKIDGLPNDQKNILCLLKV
jgi:hypothetical protein